MTSRGIVREGISINYPGVIIIRWVPIIFGVAWCTGKTAGNEIKML